MQPSDDDETSREADLIGTYGDAEVDESWIDSEPDVVGDIGEDEYGPPPEAGTPDTWVDGVTADDFFAGNDDWNEPEEQ